MLDEIHADDVALIRDATIRPAEGLTVITGETGAGKTALLGALKLIVGERADADLVRAGADGLSVEARVFTDGSSEATVVARSVTADGRSRVRIDGAMAGVGELAQLVGSTVDLCGQHDHQRLMRIGEHRAMLDEWIGDAAQGPIDDYAAAWERRTRLQDELERIEAAGKAGSLEIDGARFIISAIDEVDPRPDEYDELARDVARIENAESLARAVDGAREALSAEGGAIDGIARAAALLEGVADVDADLGRVATTLREASFAVEDAATDVRRYGEGVEYDADSLVEMQNRLGALQGLMRKWGPGIDQVLEAREEARRTVEAHDGFDERLKKIHSDIDAAEADLVTAADALSDMRTAAAPRFAADVDAQLDRLQLQGSSLVCSIERMERGKWTAQGPDRVEFLFHPGPKLPARPLTKIASGGELSRVLLAVKVVLGNRDKVPTLVFDEVDAGVGGGVAKSLAAVLADLSHSHQVIVVTHLPQVASVADRHYTVRKTDAPEPETDIVAVEGDDRVREIARMLSGDTTDAALSHARELLEEASSVQ